MKLLHPLLLSLLWGCTSLPLKPQPNPNCTAFRLRSVLKLNYLKRGVEELALISPCSLRTFTYGALKLTTDAQGRVRFPKQIHAAYITPPGAKTALYHAALASHLFTQGYYMFALRQFLALSSLPPSPQQHPIRRYFCGRWGKLAQQGASFPLLLERVGGFLRNTPSGQQFVNTVHGYALLWPPLSTLVAKSLPHRSGRLSLVTLVGPKERGRDLVLLSGHLSEAELLKIVRLHNTPVRSVAGSLRSGKLGDRPFLLSSQKRGELTLLVVIMGARAREANTLRQVMESVQPIRIAPPCDGAAPKGP